MLTIFAIPKPFQGQAREAQDNAIRSWKASNSGAAIVLCGDEEGIREACERHGVHHLPDVELSEFGTPLISSAFSRVFADFPTPSHLYLNCDIILIDDLSPMIGKVGLKSFLGVARRINIDMVGDLDTESSDWAAKIRLQAESAGKVDELTAIDWFLMKGEGPWRDPPPFIVGRPHWDNWMVFAARRAGKHVVDFSSSVAVIHQNHGYSHVPQRLGPRWGGPEAAVNQVLAEWAGSFNRRGQVFSIAHSTANFNGEQLRRNLTWDRIRAEYRLAPNTVPFLAGPLYWLQDIHGSLRGRKKE